MLKLMLLRNWRSPHVGNTVRITSNIDRNCAWQSKLWNATFQEERNFIKARWYQSPESPGQILWDYVPGSQGEWAGCQCGQMWPTKGQKRGATNFVTPWYYGAGRGIWTPDLLITNQLLYPWVTPALINSISKKLSFYPKKHKLVKNPLANFFIAGSLKGESLSDWRSNEIKMP